MKISLIYINYHLDSEVVSSIESFSLIAKSLEHEFTVFVVDNSFAERSNTEVQALTARLLSISKTGFPIRYIPSDSNIGFGAGCNKAARMSNADIFMFVNCDTSFHKTDPNSFLSFIDLFKYDNVSIIGPKVVNEVGLVHSSCFSFDPISILLKPLRHIRKVGATPFTRSLYQYHYLKRRIDRITYEGLSKHTTCRVDWVSGCFMAVRSTFFNSVDGFDQRYFLYFEDIDICRKARQLNHIVLFDSRLTVLHQARHQSARRKGILRSIIFNSAARHHVFSWLSYCWKWKYDFWQKLLLSVTHKDEKSSVFVDYNMNFSEFSYFTFNDTFD